MTQWLVPALKLVENLLHKRHFHYFVFSFLSLVLSWNFFSQGYILTLDMIFAPDSFRIADTFYGFNNQYSVLPFFAFLNFLNIFLSMELIQKFIFFFIFFVSGLSMYKLCPEDWGVGRYFASFLYMLNPFIYVRFLAGHWLILLAYSVSPFVIRAFMDFFDSPSSKKSLYLAVILTFVFFIDTHTPFLLLIVFGAFYIVNVMESGKNAGKVREVSKFAVLTGLYLLFLNSYWLVPSFIGGQGPLGEITGSDIYVFTTKQDLNFNTLFTTASMYGFWRIGYTYTKDLLPFWYLIFFIILFLTVHGFVMKYRHPKYGIYVRGFAIIAVLSVLLAAGISGPFAGVFEFLFNNVFFFKGFREPQKFVALLVLAYSYLGGVGVVELEKILKENDSIPKNGSRKRTYAYLIIALTLSTPFIYSFTMFNGFWGQLKPTDYPKDWYEVNDFLNQDNQDFNILFLPWHLYMDFKWLPTPQKRIGTPASIFFDKPVIQGENMEAGTIYSSTSNPVSRYIEYLVGNRDKIENLGELLAPLNVKYILLTKEVDYKSYDFLYKQTDIEVVNETENFVVFKNKHQVSKFYQVDAVNTIKNWDELLELSKSQDITSSGFMIGKDTNIQASKELFLNYTIDSPVNYRIEKPSKRYVIFSGKYSQDWMLDGKKPLANLGVTNVYEASEINGNTLYYRRFNIYLMGYIISGAAFLFLIYRYNKETIVNLMAKALSKKIE
jgi:hypothetical protein